MVGAVTVGVYPTSPAPEVEYLLQASDAVMVVCEDQEQLDKVLEVRTRLPLLTQKQLPMRTQRWSRRHARPRRSQT